MPAESTPITRVSEGVRLDDIRRAALPFSDEAFLLAELDKRDRRITKLTTLLEQARAEARAAWSDEEDYRDAGAMTTGDAA